MPRCKCYVAGLSPEVQFCLRWGAHSPHCPVYRPSQDPVDHANDMAFRRDHEQFGERLLGLGVHPENVNG